MSSISRKITREGKNENTNNYVWKLMTILTFRVHVRIYENQFSSSILFSNYINKILKITQVVMEGNTGSWEKDNASCLPPSCAPLIHWGIENFWRIFKKQVKIWNFRKIFMKFFEKIKQNMKNFREIFEISIESSNY